MSRQKKSKVIIVTGASSGMGKQTATTLIEQGHSVYGLARRVEKMQELVKKGGQALEVDVTKPTEIKQAIDYIVQKEGRVDILINNAGYAVYGAVEDVSLDDAKRQFEVNLFGLAEITKQVLPFMRKQKSGKIINISSMGGKMYTPLGAWYHASKHALEGWSDCLRLELKQFGIDVVIIEPGIISTEFSEVMSDPMVERAKGGPYREITQNLAKATAKNYSKENSSPASIVSELIAKIVMSTNPKTRYAVGKFAKPMIFIRKFFGDMIFDKIIMGMTK
jgi:short-subunit dehydrogenase